MKIRNGFVSNSSSSSFIIAVKGKKDYMKEIKARIMGGVEKGTLAHQLLLPYLNVFADAEKLSMDRLLEDRGYETVEEMKESYEGDVAVEKLEDGWNVFRVHVCSDSGDPIENALYDSDWEPIKTNDFYMVKDY